MVAYDIDYLFEVSCKVSRVTSEGIRLVAEVINEQYRANGAIER